MIVSDTKINIKQVVSIAISKVKIRSKINTIKISETKLNITNSVTKLINTKININNKLVNEKFSTQIGISTYRLSEIKRTKINIETDNTLNFEYYRKTLYQHNEFIKKNIEDIYSVFIAVSQKIKINDLNFDLLLKKVDDKAINTMSDLKKIFKQ